MFNQKKYELLYLKLYEGVAEEYDDMLLTQMESEKDFFLMNCKR